MMDAQEIRIRCLEAAVTASRHPTTTPPETIVQWASKFEAFVVGAPEKAARAKKGDTAS